MYKRWFVSRRDLRYLDSAKARDVIINCFYFAQRETFSRIKEKEKLLASDKDIKNTVIAAVKSVFRKVGENFDNPTKAGLAKVVAQLASQAKSWGTPDDIIEHHKKQIQIVLDALKDSSRTPIESEKG